MKLKKCKCKSSWSTYEHDTTCKHKILSIDKSYYPNLADINDYEWIYLNDSPPDADKLPIKTHKNSAVFKDPENEPHTETNCDCVMTAPRQSIKSITNYEFSYEQESDDIYYNYVVKVCPQCASDWGSIQPSIAFWMPFRGKSCQEIYDIRSKTIVLEIDLAIIDKTSVTALYVAGDHIFDLNNNESYVGIDLGEGQWENAHPAGTEEWYQKPHWKIGRDGTIFDPPSAGTLLRFAVSPLSQFHIYKWNTMEWSNESYPCMSKPEGCSSFNAIAFVLRPENTSVYGESSDVYYSGGESLVQLPSQIRNLFRFKVVRKAFIWGCGPEVVAPVPLGNPIFQYDNLEQNVSYGCGPLDQWGYPEPPNPCYHWLGYSLGKVAPGHCPPSPFWSATYTVPAIPDSYFKEHIPTYEKKYKGYWKRKNEAAPANLNIGTETIRYIKYFIETTRHATHECTHYCGDQFWLPNGTVIKYPHYPYVYEHDNRSHIKRELLKVVN